MDDAVMQERLAYAIRAAMARRGIDSSRELARRMKRDPTTVNRWVTGKAVPNALAIRPLADALGVKVEYLVDPPAIPEYPVDAYLVEDPTQPRPAIVPTAAEQELADFVTQSGVREGVRRGQSREPAGRPKPAQSRPRRTHAR